MKLGLRTPPRGRTSGDAVRVREPAARRYHLSAGAGMRVENRIIGHETNSILIVDGLLADPAAAVEFGASQVKYVPGPDMTYFPGGRGCGSDEYVETFTDRLGKHMRATFGLRDNVRFSFSNMYSLTTTAPADLRPLQKVPHVDTVGPRGLAVVHYLFDAPIGGTGFFRHRASGWETLNEERAERYNRMVAQELEESGAPGGYLYDDTPYFELVHRVEPAMDRLVIFWCHQLHSATIPPGAELFDDPRRGRLTINSFIMLS